MVEFFDWAQTIGKNPNVTVYAITKKSHFASLSREKINRRFVVTEFVKTCDELVIG